MILETLTPSDVITPAIAPIVAAVPHGAVSGPSFPGEADRREEWAWRIDAAMTVNPGNVIRKTRSAVGQTRPRERDTIDCHASGFLLRCLLTTRGYLGHGQDERASPLPAQPGALFLTGSRSGPTLWIRSSSESGSTASLDPGASTSAHGAQRPQ